MSSSQRSAPSNGHCAKAVRDLRGHGIGKVPAPPLRRLLAAFPESAAVLQQQCLVSERAMKNDQRSFHEVEPSPAHLLQHDSRVETAQGTGVSSGGHMSDKGNGWRQSTKQHEFVSGLSEVWLAEISTSLAQQKEHQDMVVPSMDISTFVGSDISHTSFSTLADPSTSFVDNESSCFSCELLEPSTTVAHSDGSTCSCNVHVETSNMHPERVVVCKTPSVPKQRELHETTWEKALPTVWGAMPRGVLPESKNNVLELLSFQLF